MLNENPINHLDTKGIKMVFQEIELGQKFFHEDFGDIPLERVAANAASPLPFAGNLVTIEPEEEVILVN